MRAVNRHKESSKKTLFLAKTTSESKNDEENLFLFWERLGTPNFSSAYLSKTEKRVRTENTEGTENTRNTCLTEVLRTQMSSFYTTSLLNTYTPLDTRSSFANTVYLF